MIVTGGENVYPREVEEVLYRFPAVQEAAVIGVPDDVWVERVHAVIILKEGQQATAEEIMGFCKQNLARYKAPKSVEFVPALPKNPQGKILKRELREKYWKGKERFSIRIRSWRMKKKARSTLLARGLVISGS
jgi:acyl-CoA synthetase (AMP-forming)/AMP-acid ligase II